MAIINSSINSQKPWAQNQKNYSVYPWSNEKKLPRSFQQAVEKAKQGIDASYLIIHNHQPVCHFFLWKAGGNPHSQKYGLEMPELGIAVADSYHDKGLGKLALHLLQEIAHVRNHDAIELTTAQDNSAGWHLYRVMGFEYTGRMRIPLEVDVTEALLKTTEPRTIGKSVRWYILLILTKNRKCLPILPKRELLYGIPHLPS